MARIYLTGSGQTKGYATGSGIISNPVRILLQEKDSKTGSYPTISRTGDPDFSGRYTSTFDDSKTINFVGGNLLFPTSLPASSIWVSGGVATPNLLQGLTAVGTSSKGIADSHVGFTPGENIRPFDESRIYIDNDSTFYQTGTDSSILPGFNQRLGSKAQIKLRFENSNLQEVRYTTGSFYRFLEDTFTVNGTNYDANSQLLQQWRLDTPQRSGTLSDQAGNSAYPASSGSSFGGSWAQSISSLIPGWQTSVSHQRPVVEEFSNRLTDFYAASTAYSGSDFGSLQDGAGAAGGSFNWNFNGKSGSGGLSISFWVKFDFIDSFRNTAAPASLENCSNLWCITSESYEVGIDKNGAIRFRAFTDEPGVRDFKTQDGFIAESEWYFLSVAYDETASPKVAIFKNGTAAAITTIDAGTGNDRYGAYAGNAFVVLGHAGTTSSEILSSSVGQWCDLSIHASKISLQNHKAMYYAPWFPTVDSNTGLSYFNFEQSKWDIIGASGSIDYTNPLPQIFSSSYLAFTPKYCGGTIGIANDVRDSDLIARTIGVPTDLCGFPHDNKFNPADTQLYSLSRDLTGPFLLEKVVYTISASLPPVITRTGGTNGDGPECVQIFLLKQNNEKYTASQLPELVQIVSGGITVPGIGGAPASNQLSSVGLSNVTKNNLLLDVGTVSRASTFSAGYSRDLNMGTAAITGTLRIESSAKIFGAAGFTALKANRFMGAAGYKRGVAPDTQNAAKMGYAPGNQVGILRNQFGGRDGLGIATSDGRSFIRSVVGSQISGTLSLNYLPFVGGSSTDTNTFLTSRTFNYEAPVYSEVTSSSPVLLFPNDKIALGFAYTPVQPMESYGYSLGKETENKLAQQQNGALLLPGSVEITLFGSLLRNNLPVSPETNQPLTSDAIHEDLHYDNPVFDQFDVEPTSALTGSYVDLIITGSMLATPIGSPVAAGVRKVQGSVAAGQAGTTGSLQRFVNLISESDLFYDTVLPDIGGIDVILGGNGTGALLELGSTGAGTSWLNSFPFEPLFASVSRNSAQSTTVFLEAYPGDTIIAQTSIDKTSNDRYFLYGKNPFFRGAVEFFGSSETYSGGLFKRWSNTSFRGLKYGLLNSRQTFTTARFRRDRYGQFRDMLEQSPNAAYLVQNSVEYPIEIGFFSRPGNNGKGRLPTGASLTHTQNLSTYATSSLPYFDNDKPAAGSTASNGVERTDNPDVTIQPVELSVTLE